MRVFSISILSSKSDLQIDAKFDIPDNSLENHKEQQFSFFISICAPDTIRNTVLRAVLFQLSCRD